MDSRPLMPGSRPLFPLFSPPRYVDTPNRRTWPQVADAGATFGTPTSPPAEGIGSVN